MNMKELFCQVEAKISNKDITSQEDLVDYLTALKDRGVITKGQIEANFAELSRLVNGRESTGKMGTRTPDTMEYAYSNVSDGFSNTGMLTLVAMSVPVLVALVNLLNK